MAIEKNPRVAAFLLFASGFAFVTAAAVGEQPAFYGVAAAMFGVGIAQLRKGRAG